MKHNKTGKKKKVGTEKIAREKRFPVLPWKGRDRRKSKDEKLLTLSIF
jgi:hypothetical protein